MRLSTLDLISAVMDRPVRPLDWAIVLHLRDTPGEAALQAGAASARRRYPSTAAVLDLKAWRSAPSAEPVLTVREVEEADTPSAVLEYLDAPWDMRASYLVRQLLITRQSSQGAVLVTRVHHAATDLVGAALWLQHQFEVAWGMRTPGTTVTAYAPPVLQRHAAPRRRSAFAFRGPADRLSGNARPPSPLRRWRALALPSASMRAFAAQDGGFTYNDLLATCALETFRRWNAARSPTRDPSVGLWLPVNIRAQPLEGFGNGSSRIRVYNRYAADATLPEKCRAVREQIAWSRQHGEWAVPENPPLLALPMRVLRPLLRAWFNRPWVDMGTGVFSHAERSALDTSAFDHVMNVELVGTLDTRHPFGVFAISRADLTFFSFVYDPAQLSEADVTELVALYQEQLASAVVLA